MYRTDHRLSDNCFVDLKCLLKECREIPSVTDILSAALDESGIGDLDDFDLGFDSGFNGEDQNNVISNEEFQVGKGTVESVPMETEDTAPLVNLDQVDMFTQALQQLSATAHLVPKAEPPPQVYYPPPPPAPVVETQSRPVGQLRPPKPPGGFSILNDVDSKPQMALSTLQPGGDIGPVMNRLPVTTSATIPHSSLQPNAALPSSVRVTMPNPISAVTSLSTAGVQRPQLPIPGSTRLIRLPSGQTIRVPATAQTIRLPSGQTVRLPPRQPVQQIRLPAAQGALSNVRVTSGQSTETIRLPSGQSKHIIRVPAGQLGQTIRLPSGQVLRLPTSIVNRSSSPVLQTGASNVVARNTSSPVTITQQQPTVFHSTTGLPAPVASKPAVVSIPNGNIPPGATVIRRQGRTYILQNTPTSMSSLTEQSTGGLSTLSNLLNSGKQSLHMVNQTGLSGGTMKLLSGGITQFQSRANHSPSPSPPPLSLPTLLSRPSASSTPPPMGIGTNGAIKTQLTSKDVSRLWSNEDLKLKNIHTASSKNIGRGQAGQLDLQPNMILDEEVEEEVQELGHAETYANYMPTKVKIGIKHPDPVVETSSLSSVEPQDAWYNVSLPESTIDSGSLSALQLEAIVYASQRHETVMTSGERAGFLIGDGAGVGKGRTVAGIIYENYLLGRKRALWLSVSNDLKVDAERDLRDIGAGKIDVHSLHKLKYAKISSKENGSVKKGVVFSTYSSLIGESQSGGKYRTRLKQLLHWCGEDFDGVIIFDECHKAKNLCPVGSSKPTKTGQTVLELQNRLPNARIVYASATGASEPRNMAYMTRLGLWGPGTPFREFTDFIQAVEKRGVGAMELVAMDIKLRGMYIARQLSFKGVSFKVEELPLNKDFIKVYNEAVKLWVQAREKFQKAAELIDAEHRMKKSMWGQFWSAHQRFFKYLCISSKVQHCVRLAREAVKDGKCVVIGLQSTGEARTLEQLEEAGGELNDFVSTAKGVFQTLVEKHFPAPDRRKTFDWFGLGDYSNTNSAPASPQSKPNKRKKANSFMSGDGKKKRGLFNESDDDNNSDGASSSDSSESEKSSSSSVHDTDDECGNPFGGSDSDEDPWLKKSMSKTKVKKKKKEKKKSKKKKKENDNSLDAKFDKALSAAGLLNKPNASFSEGSHSNSWTNGNENSNGAATLSNNKYTSADSIDQALEMKRDLLSSLDWIGDRLPPNTLDHLIDELGGTDNVAEMTGRKGRVVTNDDGEITYESRSEIDVPLEILNLTEKQRFMDGEKFIAIISEAASSGISLQADRRVLNQRRRVHVTLELPWSADRAIQQFGRTHRSNQVNAPEYVFLISELAGERRFASTVAKRLESLGALTHGDRRATETRDLSRFNFDNKYGRTALEAVMKSVMGIEPPLVPLPEYEGSFLNDAQTGLIGVGLVTIDDKIQIPVLEKDYANISKFLNRILGMPVALQNGLFKFFSETLTFIVLDAKRCGRWDMGILDLGSGSECVQKVETRKFMGNVLKGTAKTELYTVCVERGLSWLSAMGIWGEFSGSDDGFYISLQVRNGKRTSLLGVADKGSKKKEKLYRVYRPNTGLQPRMETLIEIKNKYKKVLPDDAEAWWNDQYQHSSTICSHAYWKGNCKRASMGLTCEIGLRTREYHVLAGSVLSVWGKVESVLAAMPGGSSSKMQIIRLRTEDGQRIVGSLIPGNCVAALINVLSESSTKTQTETHTTTKKELEALSMPAFF